MRKFLKLVSMLVLAATGQAFAAPFTTDNTRPVPFTTGDGPGMQVILDTVFGCAGCVDATTGQSSAGAWQVLGSNPGILPIIKFEFAGNASTNTVGIWSGTDSTALTTSQIFSGPDAPGTSAVVQWTSPTAGNITHSIPGGPITTTAFSGISQFGFGFYLDGAGDSSNRFYSADALNGGNAQMLAYQNPGPNRWMMGFEDLSLSHGADKDYNDFVFSVESITAVPEPEIYAMMAIGLALMGFVARRRQGLAAAA